MVIPFIDLVFPTFHPNYIIISKKHLQQTQTISAIFEGGPEATASFASPNIRRCVLSKSFEKPSLSKTKLLQKKEQDQLANKAEMRQREKQDICKSLSDISKKLYNTS